MHSCVVLDNWTDVGAVEAIGKENPSPPKAPKPYDLATICYTSGTTNVPKGALLTHYNLVSGAFSFSLGNKFQEGVMMSYLPLSHICGWCFVTSHHMYSDFYQMRGSTNSPYSSVAPESASSLEIHYDSLKMLRSYSPNSSPVSPEC
jgi:long-subunit acyl-CoA synthetase (AMP-forming)